MDIVVHASLREGLEETLTVQALGITGALYRTLRTTNPIENLNGSVAHYARNVKRWGDGQMVLRWVASALSDAATRMRKLRGCGQMRALLKALDARRPDSSDGACVMGPQRYRSCSALSVRCTPTSSPRYSAAARASTSASIAWTWRCT